VNYQLSEMTGHTGPVSSLSLHPYGDLILSCSEDKTVRLWPVVEPGAQPVEAAKAFSLPGAYEGSQPCPTGATFLHMEPDHGLVSYSNGDLALIDCARDMALIQRWSLPSLPERADSRMHMVSHPLLPMGIIGLEDGRLLCLDTRTGALIREIQAHQGPVAHVAIDGAGQTIVSIGADTAVKYWDMARWECRQRLEGRRPKGNEGPHCVSFHPIKSLAASGGADACVRVWGAT